MCAAALYGYDLTGLGCRKKPLLNLHMFSSILAYFCGVSNSSNTEGRKALFFMMAVLILFLNSAVSISINWQK